MSYTDAETRRLIACPPANQFTEECAELGHPGATYNPWHDLTWCRCGASVVEGDHATHLHCCGVSA